MERSPPTHRNQFFELDSSGEESADTGSNSDDDDDDEGIDGADSSRRLQKVRVDYYCKSLACFLKKSDS